MKNDCPRIDLHMHTTVSDGTDSPEAITEKVKAAGLAVFSVTDHDALTAAEIIPPLLGEGDPRFVSGVEFSCREGDEKYHILGYGYDVKGESIRAVVRRGHEIRMNKVRRRIAMLGEQFGFSFPREEIDRLLSLDNPGKPHIGNLMVKYGYAGTKKEAISEYVDRLKVKSEHVAPREAIEGILGSGGIPVLAHPYYGSGDELILGEEMETRLKKLIGYGIRGVEAFYSGFTKKMSLGMVSLAERYGLLITAGSDYHGENKMVTLGDSGVLTEGEYPDGLKRFLGIVAE